MAATFTETKPMHRIGQTFRRIWTLSAITDGTATSPGHGFATVTKVALDVVQLNAVATAHGAILNDGATAKTHDVVVPAGKSADYATAFLTVEGF